MKWISVKDRIPTQDGSIIVAIIQGRHEQGGDPIKDAEIVILRFFKSANGLTEFRTMDVTTIYYLPKDNRDYYETIAYWMPWHSFIWPEAMYIDDKLLI